MPDLAHRRADVRLLVTDSAGEPVVGVPVSVEQTRHSFGFGTIGFDFVEWVGGPPRSEGGAASEVFGGQIPPNPEQLAADWFELFNQVICRSTGHPLGLVRADGSRKPSYERPPRPVQGRLVTGSKDSR